MVRLLNLLKAQPPPAVADALLKLSVEVDGRTLGFDSTTFGRALHSALGPNAETSRTLRAATDADIQGLLAKDPSTGSKFLIEWMRNPEARKPVTPEEVGARVTQLLRVAVRPEGFLVRAADAIPAIRRPALAAASVVGGIRSLGVDLRMPKTKATAEAIGAEVTSFVGAFDPMTPILFGQINGGLNMNKFSGGQTPYALMRDVIKDSISVKGLAERHGLTVNRKQAKQLDGWVERKARFLATETTSFLKNRDPVTHPETMSGLIDVVLSDLIASGVLPPEDKPKAPGWRFLRG